MTERSENKTRRKLINCMIENEWSYQYSIFPKYLFDDYEEDSILARELIVSHVVKFKDILRKRYPDIAFLVRLRTNTKHDLYWEDGKKSLPQIYLTAFSGNECDFESVVKRCFPVESVNVIQRAITRENIKHDCDKIRMQQLNMPEKLMSADVTNSFNKFSILNRRALIARDIEEVEVDKNNLRPMRTKIKRSDKKFNGGRFTSL